MLTKTTLQKKEWPCHIAAKNNITVRSEPGLFYADYNDYTLNFKDAQEGEAAVETSYFDTQIKDGELKPEN